jgi:hypothetical protein
MDCRFDGGYCDEKNICALKIKGDQKVFSFTGEFTRIASLAFLAFRSLVCLNRKFRTLEAESKSPTFM